MTFAELRALFPSAEKCIHLNHAGASPIATPVAEAVRALTEDLMSEDMLRGYMSALRRLEALRAGFGRMMNTAPETLALVRNTSHGITIAAQAIPFQPGDSVIVARSEYPANVYPWMAQAHRGVSVHLVEPREDGLIPEEDLMDACAKQESPRVLAVSWVQWGTGQKMDLARLGTFCRERGILLVVDVVQALGALRLDLSTLPVDVATAGCHKWLLAPAGVGVLYIRPEVQQTLLPTNIGWNSVTDPIAWERLHYDELKTGASRFEEGSPNILGITALSASIDLLEKFGFDAVNDQVLAVADHTRAALKARGMRVMSPEGAGQKSGIVAFRHPSVSNEDVLEALKQANVIAAVRCGNVRLSPHTYNTEEEVDRAVAAIPSVK